MRGSVHGLRGVAEHREIDRRCLIGAAGAAMLGAMLVSGAASAQTPSGEDPLAFITLIYQRAVKEGGGSFVWSEAKDRPRFMTKSLVALFAKTDAATPQGDEGPADFDVITDTNGFTIGSFKAAPEKREATKSVIAVTLGYKEKEAKRERPHILRYDLVLEDGHWRIDDIRAKDWTLRKILEQFLTEQKKS